MTEDTPNPIPLGELTPKVDPIVDELRKRPKSIFKPYALFTAKVNLSLLAQTSKYGSETDLMPVEIKVQAPTAKAALSALATSLLAMLPTLDATEFPTQTEELSF